MAEPQGINQRLEAIRARIQSACLRSGREASSVTLIAVTKTVDAGRVQEAVAAGITDIGENRLQEAVKKLKELGAAHLKPKRHFIGTLQRNKARLAAEHFDTIHSVDSVALMEVLKAQAQRFKRPSPLEVLVQVNISGEASKHGCREEDAARIFEAAAGSDHLRAIGLMTIPPLDEDPESGSARTVFRKLRQLRDYLNPELKLSMGMSVDFETAITEGADFVRIGTGIFGERPANGQQEHSQE